MSIQTPAHEPHIAAAVAFRQFNRLLVSLPEDDYRRVARHLRRAPLRAKQVLLQQGQPVQEIIFPVRGVCSLVKTTEDGHSIEIIGIGAEGAVGASVALGQVDSATDVVVQVSDDAALSLSLDVFKEELQHRAALWTAMARYCRIFMEQLMQTSACNARHSAEARCCRWLLTLQDRIDGENVPVTQERLAMSLGLRRPTVTLIMADLQRAGLVEYRRGTMKIIDRTAMLARSCGCYPALSPRFVTFSN